MHFKDIISHHSIRKHCAHLQETPNCLWRSRQVGGPRSWAQFQRTQCLCLQMKQNTLYHMWVYKNGTWPFILIWSWSWCTWIWSPWSHLARSNNESGWVNVSFTPSISGFLYTVATYDLYIGYWRYFYLNGYWPYRRSQWWHDSRGRATDSEDRWVWNWLSVFFLKGLFWSLVKFLGFEGLMGESSFS